MSADNYALIGIHPLAGVRSTTLHGVHVGSMGSDHQPLEIPESAKAFLTHEAAVAYADELETEYGFALLCNCTTVVDQAPTTKKTVRQVIQEYTDILDHIYRTRTAGVFTWKGVLHEFMDDIASTEDE